MTKWSSHHHEHGHRETDVHKPLSPCRVFLVEDNFDDRTISKKTLEASDMVSEVVCFANGNELIEYMKREGFQDHSVICMTPTIVILDLKMPKVSGFDVLKQLKFDHFLQDIPIIVISGNASNENIRRAHELKADGFFKKPLSVDKIQSFFSRGWQWPPPDMWLR